MLQNVIVDSIDRAVQLGNNQVMYMGNPYVHAAGGGIVLSLTQSFLHWSILQCTHF